MYETELWQASSQDKSGSLKIPRWKEAHFPELLPITAEADKAKLERAVPTENQPDIFKSVQMIQHSEKRGFS